MSKKSCFIGRQKLQGISYSLESWHCVTAVSWGGKPVKAYASGTGRLITCLMTFTATFCNYQEGGSKHPAPLSKASVRAKIIVFTTCERATTLIRREN